MDILIKKDTLNKISNKIRQCFNVEEYYSALQMPNKIKDAFLSNYSTEILCDFIERDASQYIIPNGTTKIGDYAFEHYSSLTSIIIPSSVTSIGNKAFNYCRGLTSVVIPSSVTSIKGLAFLNCPNLTTINVPWSEGEVANAPWGATNATINYNYVETTE